MAFRGTGYSCPRTAIARHGRSHGRGGSSRYRCPTAPPPSVLGRPRCHCRRRQRWAPARCRSAPGCPARSCHARSSGVRARCLVRHPVQNPAAAGRWVRIAARRREWRGIVVAKLRNPPASHPPASAPGWAAASSRPSPSGPSRPTWPGKTPTWPRCWNSFAQSRAKGPSATDRPSAENSTSSTPAHSPAAADRCPVYRCAPTTPAGPSIPSTSACETPADRFLAVSECHPACRSDGRWTWHRKMERNRRY